MILFGLKKNCQRCAVIATNPRHAGGGLDDVLQDVATAVAKDLVIN
jgi:hypothetical protein